MLQPPITDVVRDAVAGPYYSYGMPPYDEILAELLRQIEAGTVTQAAVARRLGIPPPRVSEIRDGRRRIQQRELEPLAAFLGMTDGPTAEVYDFMRNLNDEEQRLVRDLAKTLAARHRP